ncbi:hypothetical protein GCM10008969_05210 [Pseudomonas veronii subsp. inensis]
MSPLLIGGNVWQLNQPWEQAPDKPSMSRHLGQPTMLSAGHGVVLAKTLKNEVVVPQPDSSKPLVQG